VARLAVFGAALISALALSSEASATVVVRYDNDSRAITFAVHAARVDVNWYARLLRNTLHGAEISDVVIRVVAPARVAALCGDADSCYKGGRGGGTVIVPAGRNPLVAHLLIHEYAHHLDAAYDLTDALEENWWSWRTGARNWWNARGLDALVARNKVAWSYRLGWSRSIGEILAEDYARLEVGGPYLIRWLRAPTRAMLRALRRDIVRELST